MYAYLRGTLTMAEENYAVIDVNGVGYQVFSGARFLNGAITGEEATLYTYQVVREDELSLYGFPTIEEKEMFIKLIGISGIGPKVGLAILSLLSVQEISQAIFAADATTFSKVSGVGKKTAERIVLELKDKVDFVGTGGQDMGEAGSMQATAVNEAIEALTTLGYGRAEAALAVQGVSALADTAEDLILLALKQLAG